MGRRLLRHLPRAAAQFVVPLLLAQAIVRGTPGGDVAILATAFLLAAYVALVVLTGRWSPRATVLVPLACLAAVPFGLSRVPLAAPSAADLAVTVLAGGLAVVLLARAAQALRGRAAVPGPAIELAAPFPAGRYLVVQGGSRTILNAHLACLAVPGLRGQGYGVDLVADGVSILGCAVLAPLDARVARAVDGLPDHDPPDTDPDRPMGNHVWLEAEGPDGPVGILLAHLRRGSVTVTPGTTVRAGARLGAVGNSGNTTEPHLHFHAQSVGEPAFTLAAEPLPIRLAGHGQPYRGQRIEVGAGRDQSLSPSSRAFASASRCAWVTRPCTWRVRTTRPMKPGRRE